MEREGERKRSWTRERVRETEGLGEGDGGAAAAPGWPRARIAVAMEATRRWLGRRMAPLTATEKRIRATFDLGFNFPIHCNQACHSLGMGICEGESQYPWKGETE